MRSGAYGCFSFDEFPPRTFSSRPVRTDSAPFPPVPARADRYTTSGGYLIVDVFSFLRRRRLPGARFWKWFQQNEDELFRMKSPREEIFVALVSRILSVDRNLVFEFGPEIDGRREFVLSAGGFKSAFPVVIALADAAPHLSRWTITRFRPRRAEITEVQFGGTAILPDAVMVAVLPGIPHVDIIVFLGGDGMDEQTRGQLGFLFLDQALGEFDVATYVGSVEFKPLSEPSPAPKTSLRAFVREFDLLKARFN